jgi:hypothetical protein
MNRLGADLATVEHGVKLLALLVTFVGHWLPLALTEGAVPVLEHLAVTSDRKVRWASRVHLSFPPSCLFGRKDFRDD